MFQLSQVVRATAYLNGGSLEILDGGLLSVDGIVLHLGGRGALLVGDGTHIDVDRLRGCRE